MQDETTRCHFHTHNIVTSMRRIREMDSAGLRTISKVEKTCFIDAILLLGI